MKIPLVFIVAVAICSGAVLATELGVIYYHETMMTSGGQHYMARSVEGVTQDLRDIHTIANNIKLFTNPFTDVNADWTEQVNSIAQAEGMYTVVTMMVDDRKITDANWGEYSSRVVSLCERFNGKADEFHVGNEITLHSDLSREDIKNRVVQLIGECEQKFSGPVSYQEFWYAHDVWKGYGGRIYFMMYENFGTFQGNMVQLQADHPNAAIGEWGEDQLEDQTAKDEAWQKDQIQRRWQIINDANIPVAYIFTYREPSDNGFGMLRPDGSRKPLWEVFGATSSPPPAEPPAEPPEVPDNSTDTPDNSTDIPDTPTVPDNSTDVPDNETDSPDVPDNSTQVPDVPDNSTNPEVPDNSTAVPTNVTGETPDNATENETDEEVVEETDSDNGGSSGSSGGGGGGSSWYRRQAQPERTYEFETLPNGEVVAFIAIEENETNTTSNFIGVNSISNNSSLGGSIELDTNSSGSGVDANGSAEAPLSTVTDGSNEAGSDTADSVRDAREAEERALQEQEQPGFLTRVWLFITSIFG